MCYAGRIAYPAIRVYVKFQIVNHVHHFNSTYSNLPEVQYQAGNRAEPICNPLYRFHSFCVPVATFTRRRIGV